jgi:hypothetical protein
VDSLGAWTPNLGAGKGRWSNGFHLERRSFGAGEPSAQFTTLFTIFETVSGGSGNELSLVLPCSVLRTIKFVSASRPLCGDDLLDPKR